MISEPAGPTVNWKIHRAGGKNLAKKLLQRLWYKVMNVWIKVRAAGILKTSETAVNDKITVLVLCNFIISRSIK